LAVTFLGGAIPFVGQPVTVLGSLEPRRRSLVTQMRAGRSIALGLFAPQRRPLVGGRITARSEELVGSLLIGIRASLITIACRLILVASRLILVASGLILVSRGLVLITRRLIRDSLGRVVTPPRLRIEDS
jgi:hypothetical protein